MSANESRLYAREQEQSVLGALLQNNDAIDRIGDLRVEHFYDGMHRAIFSAILKLVLAAKPADVITVFEALQAQGSDADLPYLNSLAQNTPSSANIARYAETVRDRAIKRGLIAECIEVADAVPESPEDAATLVDRMTSALEKLAQATVKDEPVLARDELAAHIDSIDARFNGAISPAISTGLPDLDRKLNGGPRRGNLVVLAARPKMGKTALALNIANHVAAHGVAAVLSMEMGKPELHDRNIASLGQIHLDHVTDPLKMTDEDWPRLTVAVQKLNDMRLYLDAQPGLTLMHVRNKAKQIKRKAGALDLLVIDYLQLMNGEGDSRNAQIEAITRGLKNLAKELDIVILLLSQLNRELERRPNKRPVPSDLRDSGSIEQDADIAIFLYRDEVYNPDSNDKGICEANVALNRQGASGVVPLVYIGEHTRFESIQRPWSPAPPKSAPVRSRGFSDDE
jgi:replicative DNA helicase